MDELWSQRMQDWLWGIALQLDWSTFDLELEHAACRQQAHVGHGKARKLESLSTAHVLGKEICSADLGSGRAVWECREAEGE